MLRLICFCLSLCLMPPAVANQHHHQHGRQHHHGMHTPFGIMGEHLMDDGEWMLSYRFMRMDMAGNRDGTDRVATPLPGFMVSPLAMTMDMHMVGIMRGLGDTTLMLMLPAINSDMDHVVNGGMMAGTEFNTSASGPGDISLTAIMQLVDRSTLLNIGLSIPTGSIDKTDVTPASAGTPVQLPYPMQTGSGTLDLLLGISRTGHTTTFSWGLQGKATLRTGSNDNGYTLGNALQLSGWISKPLGDSVAVSARLQGSNLGNIDGADTTLAATPTVPTKNPKLRGGSRIDLLLGCNTRIGRHIFGLELGWPIYQNLDGPQLETDMVITAGWQASF